MRTLRIICVVFGSLSAAVLIQGGWDFNSTAHTFGMRHAFLNVIWPLLLLGFWAGAFYGIHKKALIAWKLGWGVIAAELLALPTWALSATSRFPGADHPGVAAAAVIAGFGVVVLYWGFWWAKQKSHFVKPGGKNEPFN
jgi:hypothetical protein